MQRFVENYGFELGNESALSEINYDWSDVSIGDETFRADTFFKGERHIEHERQPAIRFETTEDEFSQIIENDVHEENDENNPNVGNVQNADSVNSSNISSDLDEMHIDPTASNESTEPKSNHQPNQNVRKKLPKAKAPDVYLKIEFAKRKREAMLAKIEKEAREKRKFHAKKAPNFKKAHEVQAVKMQRTDEQKHEQLTIPVTPNVVHHHQKSLERVRAKRLEYEESQKPKPFVSKEPDVLFKDPFVPVYTKKPPTTLAPFNLQSEDRLQKRHEFDERVKMEMERKEWEAQEYKKAEDEIIRRELRKQATFKANPNPFSQN